MTLTTQASCWVLFKAEKANCIFTACTSSQFSRASVSVSRIFQHNKGKQKRNYVQVSCLLALLQFTRCSWAPLEDAWVIKQHNTQQCVQDTVAWWDKKEKAIKISVTLHRPVHDTNDLGGFKMCHNNFNMCCKAWIVVTDIQLIASFIFPVNWVMSTARWTEECSLFKWVTLLYCFATNQGHCMLIKFTVDGLNRINAQAHNQRYSLNIFKWPYCEDDLILLCNTARQDVSLAVEPVSPCFPVRQEPHSYSVAQPCCGKEIARERRAIRKRHSSLSPHLLSSLAPTILHYC